MRGLVNRDTVEIGVECGSNSTNEKPVFLLDPNESLFNVHYPVFGEHSQPVGRIEKRNWIKSVSSTDRWYVGLQIAHQTLDNCGAEAILGGEAVAF